MKQAMMAAAAAAALLVPGAVAEAAAETAAEAVGSPASLTNQSGSLRGSVGLASSVGCTERYWYDCRYSQACCDAGLACYEKNQYWAACLNPGTCIPGATVEGDPDPRPWTCRIFGAPPVQPTPPPQQTTPPPPQQTTPPPQPPSPAPQPLPPSPALPCEDLNANCAAWAASNECTDDPGYMNVNCQKSCGLCS